MQIPLPEVFVPVTKNLVFSGATTVEFGIDRGSVMKDIGGKFPK